MTKGHYITVVSTDIVTFVSHTVREQTGKLFRYEEI